MEARAWRMSLLNEHRKTHHYPLTLLVVDVQGDFQDAYKVVCNWIILR